MKWLNDYTMRLMLVGLVAAVVFGGVSARADFTFGEPVNLGPTINSSYSEGTACISSDGLELYFNSDGPGGFGSLDIWVSRRASVSDSWAPPANPGSPLNYPGCRNCPYCLSVDGLELYFGGYNRPGGYGSYDLWVTRRTTKDDAWGEPENLGPTINRSSYDEGQWISSDGLELYFHSDRPGGFGSFDIWVSRRATKNDPWTEPINLGAIVNSSARDAYPCLSADGLLLFFSGLDYRAPYRPGGFGGSDMWVTRRASISDPWDAPLNLGSMINSPYHEEDPRLSSDGSTLYFMSDRPGGYGGTWGDIWQAPIIPIVDFNGDGIVDSADICIMVDHWGEYYPFCDIGPTPLGDGIVDVQDLIVLAEHLFEEVNDLTLVAHWALDEIEGDIASDSANDNDGNVYGDPAWQPEGGMIDGALQLDGIDDYVNTPFVLNPADGKFSLFAWIKGGAPGQAVLSQMGGANWLCVDPSEGNLITELKASGRGATELLSQTIITDGNWHRIGLVWDSSHRTLYVDDIAVAEDTQPDLEASENGLYIGTGMAMEAGSFWSGLIDDVRIYNRAVTP